MKQCNKIISGIVLFCFIFNTAISDLAFGQSLATQSKFSNLQDMETKDIGDIELWFAAALNYIKDQGLEINCENLQLFAKDNLPGKTIFQLPNAQFFIHEITPSDDGVVKIKVKRSDLVHKTRFYFIEYTPQTQRLDVYPEGKSKLRTWNDRDAIDGYKELNEKVIDKFIEDQIAKGNFAEIEGRAEALGWDSLYPGRIKPKSYWPKQLLENVNKDISRVLSAFNLSFDEAFKGKNIVFIKIPKGTKEPIIKIGGRKISVSCHTSNKALYVFLDEDTFQIIENCVLQGRPIPLDAVEKAGHIAAKIFHETGVAYGIESKQIDNGAILSDLDMAGILYISLGINRPELARRFPHLKNLKPVNLDTNLVTRDYAAGQSKDAKPEIRGLALSRNIGESIMIGDDIEIKVLGISPLNTKLLVMAPQDTIISRLEKAEKLEGQGNIKDSKNKDKRTHYVITRKHEEGIGIKKGDAVIRVYAVRQILEKVTLVIDGPTEIPVHRIEIWAQIKAESQAAAGKAKDELRGVDEAIARLEARMPERSKSLQVTDERKAEVISAARYMKMMLPENNTLTLSEIVDCIVSKYTNWLHEYRQRYSELRGVKELLPPTFTFSPKVYPEYPGEKPRYISFYLKPQFPVLEVIHSRAKDDKDISAKGGDRLVYLDSTTFIMQIKGDKTKKVKAALLQVADLSSTMKPKSLWWASGFDGSKTFSMANTEMLGITKEMTNKEKAGLIKEELLPCVASFISAGILCGLCRFGPDMNTGELQDVIIDEAYQVQKELGVEHPILASTSGDPERGSFSHAELRATSLGAIETMLPDIENAELTKQYGIDPNHVTISIMGFGEVTTGEIYWLKEEHPDLAGKLLLCGVSNVPQDDRSAGGGVWNAGGFSWDELVRLSNMRNDKLRASGGIDTFHLMDEVKEPCRKLPGVNGARDVLFQGADIVMPAAVADVFTTVEDVKRLKEAGTKMLYEPANNSIRPNVVVTAGEIRRNLPKNMTIERLNANLKKYEGAIIYLEDVFDIFDIYLKHGPITNGGGIRASREQVEHWEREGRDALIRLMRERGIHVQDDIADMAVLHTLWLTRKHLETGKSPFRLFLEGVGEIEKLFYELLNNPDDQMKALTETYLRSNARLVDARHFAAADLAHDSFFLKGLRPDSLIKQLDGRNKTIYGREIDARMAFFALGRIPLTSGQRNAVVKKAIEALNDVTRDPQVRKSAAECLGFILAAEALPALEKARTDLNKSVVVWANWAMERIKTVSSSSTEPVTAASVFGDNWESEEVVAVEARPTTETSPYFIGMSMGGTKLYVALYKRTAGKPDILGVRSVLLETEFKLVDKDDLKDPDKVSPDRIFELMKRLIRELLAENSLSAGELNNIGCTSPGPIDSDKGIVGAGMKTLNLPFAEYPLVQRVRDAFGLSQAEVKHDAQSGLEGEMALGQLYGIKNCYYVIQGTGLGGSPAKEGKYYENLPDLTEPGHHVVGTPVEGRPFEYTFRFIWNNSKVHPFEVVAAPNPNNKHEITEETARRMLAAGQYKEKDFIWRTRGEKDFEDIIAGKGLDPLLAGRDKTVLASLFGGKAEDYRQINNLSDIARCLRQGSLGELHAAKSIVYSVGQEVGKGLACLAAAAHDKGLPFERIVLGSTIAERLGIRDDGEMVVNADTRTDYYFSFIQQSAYEALRKQYNLPYTFARNLSQNILRSNITQDERETAGFDKRYAEAPAQAAADVKVTPSDTSWSGGVPAGTIRMWADATPPMLNELVNAALNANDEGQDELIRKVLTDSKYAALRTQYEETIAKTQTVLARRSSTETISRSRGGAETNGAKEVEGRISIAILTEAVIAAIRDDFNTKVEKKTKAVELWRDFINKRVMKDTLVNVAEVEKNLASEIKVNQDIDGIAMISGVVVLAGIGIMISYPPLSQFGYILSLGGGAVFLFLINDSGDRKTFATLEGYFEEAKDRLGVHSLSIAEKSIVEKPETPPTVKKVIIEDLSVAALTEAVIAVMKSDFGTEVVKKEKVMQLWYDFVEERMTENVTVDIENVEKALVSKMEKTQMSNEMRIIICLVSTAAGMAATFYFTNLWPLTLTIGMVGVAYLIDLIEKLTARESYVILTGYLKKAIEELSIATSSTEDAKPVVIQPVEESMETEPSQTIPAAGETPRGISGLQIEKPGAPKEKLPLIPIRVMQSEVGPDTALEGVRSEMRAASMDSRFMADERRPKDLSEQPAVQAAAEAGSYQKVNNEYGFDVFTLTNEAGNSIQVVPGMSATIKSLKVGGKEMLYYPEGKIVSTGGIPGPFFFFANRIKDGEFEWERKTYYLKPFYGKGVRSDQNGNALHGILDQARWTVESSGFTQADSKGKRGVYITLTYDAGKDSTFTGIFGANASAKLTVTYQLIGDDLAIKTNVSNDGDKSFPFSTAIHPWLLRDGENVTYASSDTRHWVADERIPKALEAATGDHDFNNPKRLDKPYDDVYTGAEGDADGYASSTLTRQDGTTITLMRQLASYPHSVLWAPSDRPVVGVEAQSAATNAVNMQKGPLAKEATLAALKSGDEWRGTVILKVGKTQAAAEAKAEQRGPISGEIDTSVLEREAPRMPMGELVAHVTRCVPEYRTEILAAIERGLAGSLYKLREFKGKLAKAQSTAQDAAQELVSLLHEVRIGPSKPSSWSGKTLVIHVTPPHGHGHIILGISGINSSALMGIRIAVIDAATDRQLDIQNLGDYGQAVFKNMDIHKDYRFEIVGETLPAQAAAEAKAKPHDTSFIGGVTDRTIIEYADAGDIVMLVKAGVRQNDLVLKVLRSDKKYAGLLAQYEEVLVKSKPEAGLVARLQVTVDSKKTLVQAAEAGTPASLDSPIMALNLSTRVFNILDDNDIVVVGDITRRSFDELLKIKHFGVVALDEVREKLASKGYHLRGEELSTAEAKAKLRDGSFSRGVPEGTIRIWADATPPMIQEMVDAVLTSHDKGQDEVIRQALAAPEYAEVLTQYEKALTNAAAATKILNTLRAAKVRAAQAAANTTSQVTSHKSQVGLAPAQTDAQSSVELVTAKEGEIIKLRDGYTIVLGEIMQYIARNELTWLDINHSGGYLKGITNIASGKDVDTGKVIKSETVTVEILEINASKDKKNGEKGSVKLRVTYAAAAEAKAEQPRENGKFGEKPGMNPKAAWEIIISSERLRGLLIKKEAENYITNGQYESEFRILGPDLGYKETPSPTTIRADLAYLSDTSGDMPYLQKRLVNGRSYYIASREGLRILLRVKDILSEISKPHTENWLYKLLEWRSELLNLGYAGNEQKALMGHIEAEIRQAESAAVNQPRRPGRPTEGLRGEKTTEGLPPMGGVMEISQFKEYVSKPSTTVEDIMKCLEDFGRPYPKDIIGTAKDALASQPEKLNEFNRLLELKAPQAAAEKPVAEISMKLVHELWYLIKPQSPVTVYEMVDILREKGVIRTENGKELIFTSDSERPLDQEVLAAISHILKSEYMLKTAQPAAIRESFKDLGNMRGKDWWDAMETGRQELLIRFLGAEGTEPVNTIPFDHHKPKDHYGHPELTAAECMLLIAHNMSGYVSKYLIHPGYLLGRLENKTAKFVDLRTLAKENPDVVRQNYGSIVLHPDLPQDKRYVLKWEGENTPNGDLSKGEQYRIGNRPTNQAEELKITAEEIARVPQVVGLKFMTYVDASASKAYENIIAEVKEQSIIAHSAGLLFFPEDLPAKTVSGKDLKTLSPQDKVEWEANNPLLFAKALSEGGVDYDAYKFTFPGNFNTMTEDKVRLNLRDMASHISGRLCMMLSGGDAKALVRKAQMSSEELPYVGNFAGRGVWQASFTSVASNPNDVAGVKAQIAHNLKEGDARKQYESLDSVKPRMAWWEYLGLQLKEEAQALDLPEEMPTEALADLRASTERKLEEESGAEHIRRRPVERIEFTGEEMVAVQTRADVLALKEAAPYMGEKLWNKVNKYHFILPFEFFKDGDVETHARKYGDRFDIERVGGVLGDMNVFIDNILKKVKPGEEAGTIALVPMTDDLKEEHLERLKKAGIRFVPIGLGDLASIRQMEDGVRSRFQEHTYATMELFRFFDDETALDARVYAGMSLYIRANFALKEGMTLTSYVDAVKKCDVAALIKGYLSFKKFEIYDADKEYREISHALIFA